MISERSEPTIGVECTACHGEGEIECDVDDENIGAEAICIACPTCRGYGRVEKPEQGAEPEDDPRNER